MGDVREYWEQFLSDHPNRRCITLDRQTTVEIVEELRELEAEVYVVREASDNWRECAEDWRKRAEKAEAENARLREAGQLLYLHADGSNMDVPHAMRKWREAKRGTHG